MNAVRSRLGAAVCACSLLVGVTSATPGSAAAPAEGPASRVEANDNRHPAGTLEGDVLTLSLRAGVGRWQPEGPAGPSVDVEAFGEIGAALTVPAPLIRVPAGTEIAASIRNDLSTALVVHGLCPRGGPACAPLEVSPGQTRRVRFRSGPAGTYHYWASTLGAPVPFRELAGAFVVDPPAGSVDPDRVIVITEWTSLTPRQLGQVATADVPTEAFVGLAPRVTFVMNGLSWPATERLHYATGQVVRWRIVNLSSQAHPLHLHGFYFEVNSAGDGLRDTEFDAASRRRVVTEFVPPGGTLRMTWVPERAGHWLFHCHVMHHVSLSRRLADDGRGADPAAHPDRHGSAHGLSAGMAGMVMGVTVRDSLPTAAAAVTRPAAQRRLRLTMAPLPGQLGEAPVAGFVLSDAESPATTEAIHSPGPAIVLRRDQPVEITLENRLAEATAIHWHGMELDSYYDGVHGFSGVGAQVTPMIEPGEQFVVRFTPPRAGTFIYHTHLHDYRQLTSGLYGPLIVSDTDEAFDPVTDHVIILGRRGVTAEGPSLLTEPDSVVMNGERAPRLVWKAGTRHRIRLINITPDDTFSVSLQTAEGPVLWTPVAKDGAPVPAAAPTAVPARQTIAVGETYDFHYQAPGGRKTAWLDVRTPGGKWQVQGHVVVR
jgi:FtsP/CotA-like multicopper oxidase with cupredoxin domain